MLTIDLLRRARIVGTTARIKYSVPLTLASITRS
jgi:hypothetical protein